MEDTEAVGRFIYGMILQDDPSNAMPVGHTWEQDGRFCFTVEMDIDGGPGVRIVHVSVKVEQ